ncbi:Asparagine synthetase domain-containing protein 1 [Auxenochlorella protothecoides]|uniref:Asparagine synthetase domain-containing protein 1 n=2 Tax=Auxenochlorella protothecoides TaxID=3075 RepID=A0A087SM74_AUXPR|nr:Asparagine synthetase domain-containing protein 1 [Auxenochlorella protothecoides]KFM26828.1 Asparagine synthetase domain-containing protein 1 [Auxenochlorella protothecoides]RMZ55762.1 hypothetical protein APUTEX25_005803 [Auxenochlorella protothecoides]|eukprot:RMZ55762.1 hypothetical protein APUTEX25_005803 [Auxenochlorella protothecoides]
MCGILCLVGRDGGQGEGLGLSPTVRAEMLECLRRRGPDHQSVHEVATPSGATLEMHGSLLQLRGSAPSRSPLLDPATGSLLCFNGEVFGGLPVCPGANDAQALFCALTQATSSPMEVLSRVQGPWALVYWHAPSGTLWFGRDATGRRSLLCSLAMDEAESAGSGEQPSLRLEFKTSLSFQQQPGAPFILCSLDTDPGSEGAPPLHELPPGLYSLPLGRPHPASAHQFHPQRHPWPWVAPLRPSHLIPEGPQGPTARPSPEALRRADERVLCALRAAVAARCQLPECARPGHLKTAAPSTQAPLMVLFSGGVDSTLLAALAHQALPPCMPIDLVSVCFDAGRSPDRLSALDALRELRAWAPRRRWRLVRIDCGLADVDAHAPRLLRLLSPAATVMDLNIGAALWLAARGAGRACLGDGEAQGGGLVEGQGAQAGDEAGIEGVAVEEAGGQEYTSAARVVLMGHGADELCGGYGRHRTKFREGGWEGLNAEMALDMQRLWLRNLGRDDRLVADHGREARHPFLDEGVVAAVLDSPLACVTDLRLPSGQGDKRVLRAALCALGLPRAAARPKRAIQFGTRICRLNNIRQFGGTRKANMANAGSVLLSDLACLPPVESAAAGRGVEQHGLLSDQLACCPVHRLFPG